MRKIYKSPQIFEQKILLTKILVYEHSLSKKEKKRLAKKWNVKLTVGEELYIQYDFNLATLLCMEKDLNYFLFMYPKATIIHPINLKEIKRIKSLLREVSNRIEKLERLGKKK